MTAERLALLRELKLIVYDEGFNGNRSLPECFVEFLERMGCNVRILILGDSQQLTATVPNGSEAEKVDANLVSSHAVFHSAERVLLKVQHRQAGDVAYANVVRSVGNGTHTSLAWHPFHNPSKHMCAVVLPQLTNVFHDMDSETVEASMRTAIEWLFGRVNDRGDPDPNGRLCTSNRRRRTGAAAYEAGVRRRAIICATNTQKDTWNALIHKMTAEDNEHFGSVAGKRYKSVDVPGTTGDDSGEHELAEQAIAEDSHLYQHLDPSVPRELLNLEIGDIVMLAKTMCHRSHLVKNETFTIHTLRQHTIVLVDNAGHLRTIPRARFMIEVNHAGNIRIARKQFPLHHAWAQTVHKSQGSTYERSLIDLRYVYWEHGQAYVALGRTRCAADTGAFVAQACSIPRSGGGVPVPVMAAVCIPALLAR